MKKLQTYYFLLATVGSVLIYKFLEFSNHSFKELFEHLFGKSEPMPHLTAMVFDYSLWPLVLAAISGLFVFVAAKAKSGNPLLRHVLILLLLTTILGLALTIAGYTMPIIEPLYELGS